MSEIERYDCEEDRSCEYEVKAVMQVNSTGYYVRHADHLVYLNEMRMDRDAQRLRADTAEAKAADYLSAWEKCAEFRDAAEQRIAELWQLVEKAYDYETIGGDWIEEYRRLKMSDAALNQKSEGESQ